MKKAIKKRWVKALRSGDYKQGTEFLHQRKDGVDQWCCLGVLCDVEGVPSEPRQSYVYPEENTSEKFRMGGSISILSPELLTKFGLTDIQQGKLANMNDHQGKSFVEIADFVEKEIKE